MKYIAQQSVNYISIKNFTEKKMIHALYGKEKDSRSVIPAKAGGTLWVIQDL